MSILHADNFSIYGSTVGLMLNGIYTNVGGCTLVNDPDGISPGKVLRPAWNGLDNTNINWQYPLQNGATEAVGVAFRLWCDYMPNDASLASRIVQFRDIGNNVLASVGTLPNGALRFLINETAHDTTIPVVSAQGWYHIEVFYSHAAGGLLADYEIRVEGQTVLFGDVTDAINADIGIISAFNVEIGGHAMRYQIKDLVIWDTGGTQNNDFLGSVLVANLMPQADVDLNWALTTGTTGAAILDNIPPNDASYIYAIDPPPPAYVASLTDLSVDATSVRALITFVRASKSDGGDGSLQVGVISDEDTALGANRPITVAQTYWRDVFELNPATAAPWLPGEVNSALLQINRTA